MANNLIWSTIYLGNLADMDTDESSMTQENSSALLTTFGAGPGNALANNIVDVHTYTVEADDVTVNSNNFPTNDYLQYDLGAGSVSTKVDSMAVLQGTVTFYSGTTYATELRVFQTANGDVFLVIPDDNPTLASDGIDTITFTSVVNTNLEGIDQFNKNDLDFVCVGPGTRIATPLGPRRADTLTVSDLVTTLDHGPQPIRWIGKRRLRFAAPDPAQPVLIRRGALGEGRPRRDLLLSPNHRVLVATRPTHALHDPLGALAPAKALTRQQGIRPAHGRHAITYFSFLLPRHAVMIAESVAIESLYPGPETWAALSGAERSDWLRLAAEARVTGSPPARLLLSVAEARAGLDAGDMTLPATEPVPRLWTGLTPRPRLLPGDLAEGGRAGA